jgi:hypothetical protein
MDHAAIVPRAESADLAQRLFGAGMGPLTALRIVDRDPRCACLRRPDDRELSSAPVLAVRFISPRRRGGRARFG